MDSFSGLATLVGDSFNSMADNFNSLLPQIIVLAIIGVIILIIYKILTATLRHGLKRVVKIQDDVDSIMRIWRYSFFFIAAIIIIFAFSGNLAAAGISIGLLSAALGWALQRPITGIAAWMMITIKKPLKVGDRVLIETVHGDIKDITMFYIVLEEIGGTVAGEDNSERTILIPTATLFEKAITNYNIGSPYILDEVVNEYTYESNLAKIEKIVLEVSARRTKDYLHKTKSNPFTRISFTASGMKVAVRYYVKTRDRATVKSDITREIYNRIMKEPDAEFAYPHTQIVFKKNGFEQTKIPFPKNELSE